MLEGLLFLSTDGHRCSGWIARYRYQFRKRIHFHVNYDIGLISFKIYEVIIMNYKLS